MQTTSARRGRVAGVRAVIEFAPKLVSIERLCAGVVIRTDDGQVTAHCAIDLQKAEHAFGTAGLALYEVASKLCDSLQDHWQSDPDIQAWTPPI